MDASAVAESLYLHARTPDEIAADATAAEAFWRSIAALDPPEVDRIRRQANPAAALVRDIAAATPAFAARQAAARAARRTPPPAVDERRRIRLPPESLALLPAPRTGPPPDDASRRRHRAALRAWLARMDRIATSGDLPPEARPIRETPPVLAALVQRRRDRLLHGYRRGRVAVVGMTPDRALEIATAALELGA